MTPEEEAHYREQARAMLRPLSDRDLYLQTGMVRCYRIAGEDFLGHPIYTTDLQEAGGTTTGRLSDKNPNRKGSIH